MKSILGSIRKFVKSLENNPELTLDLEGVDENGYDNIRKTYPHLRILEEKSSSGKYTMQISARRRGD